MNHLLALVSSPLFNLPRLMSPLRPSFRKADLLGAPPFSTATGLKLKRSPPHRRPPEEQWTGA